MTDKFIGVPVTDQPQAFESVLGRSEVPYSGVAESAMLRRLT